jgi:membrane-bound serine protease (ClpP class)
MTAPERLLPGARVNPAAVPEASEAAGDAEAVQSDVGLAAAGMELLAVPEVAFVLVAAGLLAAAVWAAQPQLWQLGGAAVPVLAAGSTGMLLLPASPGAVLLLTLAAASLAMEVYSLPGLMVHAAGAAFSLALAGLCLHGTWAGAHPMVSIPAAVVVGLGTWSAARQSWRAARADPLSTSSRLVGRELVVLQVVDGHVGRAVVAGQIWAIRDPQRHLREGRPARVTGQRGDELLVRQGRGFLGNVD